MREPKIHHYPQWLREIICEPFPTNNRAFSTDKEVDEDLRRLHAIYRQDPIATILFDLVIESIRNRFRLWGMKQKINDLDYELNQMKLKLKDAGIMDVLD